MRQLLIAIVFILPVAASSQVFPDLGIPDSAYAPNQLIVWFNDGLLVKESIGNYGERVNYPYGNYGKHEMNIDANLFTSVVLTQYLQSRGVISCRKLVSWIDPFQDTLSISRSGDTLCMVPYWNILLLEFDPLSEANMVVEALSLMYSHYGEVLWAQPNMKYEIGSMSHARQEKDIKSLTRCVLYNDLQATQKSLLSFPEGINIEPCWAITTGSEMLRVAIVDDGIHNLNPDFVHTTKNKLYFKASHGGKKDYEGSGDNGGHGTQMAGILGALTNNGASGVAGIAGGDNQNIGPILLALDCARGTNVYSSYAFDALAEATISNSVGFGCHLANVSLYAPNNDFLLKTILADAYRHNAIVTACMGNRNKNDPWYPAANEDQYVIAVGGKDETYMRYSLGNYGNHMDLMGPAYSDHIYTTVDNGVGFSGGETSAATAHVTGVASLLISHYNTAPLNLDQPYYPEDIENLLEAGAVDGAGTPSTVFSDEYGWGYLNAWGSLSLLISPNVLKHYQSTYILTQLPAAFKHYSDPIFFYDINSPSHLNSATLTNVDEYKIQATFNYRDVYSRVNRVWGIGNQKSGQEGYSTIHQARDNSGNTYNEAVVELGYTKVIEYNQSSCTVETSFYHGVEKSTNKMKWVPFDPLQAEGVKYFVSVSGVLKPLTTESNQAITNPDYKIEIFPNPIIKSTETGVTILLGQESKIEDGSIVVCDRIGRVCFRGYVADCKISRNAIKINVADFQPGIYYVTLFAEKVCTTNMFVIQ